MNLSIKLPSAAAWLAGAMLWASGAPAQAEDAAQSQNRPDRLVMVGLGPRLEPSFPGSSRTSIGVEPVVNVWREDQPLPVETPDEGKGPTIFGTRNGNAAGLTFAFAPRRGSETATQGLRKVGFGIEAGLFAESYVQPNVRLRAEARHAIGAHAALVGDAALDLVLRSKRNDRAMLTLGPRVRFGSGEYNRRFYGIELVEAAASGLAPYRPGAGIHAVGAVAGAHWPIDSRWGLFGFAGYDRLVGPAASSPLVKTRGRTDQINAGLALTYVFRIKR